MDFNQKLTEALASFGPAYEQILSGLKAQYPQYLDNPKYGICSHVVSLITKELVSLGINDFTITDGTVIADGERLSHTWLNHAGRIYDPTSGQFQNGYEIATDDYSDEYTPEQYLDEYGSDPAG